MEVDTKFGWIRLGLVEYCCECRTISWRFLGLSVARTFWCVRGSLQKEKDMKKTPTLLTRYPDNSLISAFPIQFSRKICTILPVIAPIPIH